MYSITLLALSSFLLALLFTPLCRNAFRYLGVVDQPDRERKLHAAPTPRAGGVAIALAYVAAFGILLLVPFKAKSIVLDGLPLVLRLLPAAAVIFVTGLLDDTLGLKPWQKMFGEFTGALLAFGAGVQIRGIHGVDPGFWWSLPLTIFWLLACTNAFNLIDGLDGLAAGIGAFAAATTMTVALLQGHVSLAMATAPLVGALIGFLRYNFQPASVFLGDTGSLLIGFMLGSYAVLWSHKADTLFGMTAPIMVLAIPLLDTSLSIMRRFIRQKPIFSGDRGHIHHRLLDRGHSPRRVALLMYVLCGVAAIFSFVTSIRHNIYAGVTLLVFCGVAVLWVRYLGYIEFSLLGRLVSQGTVRHMVSAQVTLATFESELASAANLDDQWHAIRQGCKALGFSRVRLWMGDRVFEERFEGPAPRSSCVTRIPLAENYYAECERCLDTESGALVLIPFGRILRHHLTAKSPHTAQGYSVHAASL